MLRQRTALSHLGLAGLILSLAACGGPSDTAAPADAPAPAAETPQPPETPAAAAHDEDHHEENGHDDDHDAAELDEHEHEEHDHMAGGEAHVHGKAEVAMVLEGATLSLSMETPLHNFGVREAAPETEEQQADLDALGDALVDASVVFTVNAAAGCSLTESEVGFRHSGMKGDATLVYSYDCAHPDRLEKVTVNVFGPYPNFEEVDVVILSGGTQSVGLLNPGSTELAWPRGS